jgi:hypothetical protein
MNNNIFKKSLAVSIIILFIGAGISITATSKIQKSANEIEKSSFSDRRWSDDFSSYTLGQFLDGDPTDGGWKGWENNPAYGAFIVDDQEHSDPHSVEIVGDSDLVHEYSGFTTGQWTYIAWQYIPSDFFGESAFILLNQYDDSGSTNSWSTQLRFNADNSVVHSDFDDNELPLIFDQWVEIRVEIDLDADIQDIYYDGDLLVSKSWKDGLTGGGIANIGAVDLFANAATAVYYDDISLSGETPIPAVCCQGEFNWTDVQPGNLMAGTFEVSNCGDIVSELDWEVSEWPTWGSGWTFTPASGTGLTPAQSWQTVTVEFTAPTLEEKEFTGSIKVINSNDPADYCEIPIYLKTPKAISNSIQKLFNNHPNIFPIIRQILNL